MTERTAYWGHWDISFWEKPEGTPWGQPGNLVARIFFPVSTRGPMDAMPGQRDRYNRLIREWRESGVLPTVEA
jgi:hypothetical protein